MRHATMRALAQVLHQRLLWIRAARRPYPALRPLSAFTFVKGALAIVLLAGSILIANALQPGTGRLGLEAPSQQTGQAPAPTGSPRLPTTVPTLAPQPAEAAAFVGDSSTGFYHRPGCSVIAGILPGHKVTFSSRGEAVGKGFRPCPHCSP